MRKDNVKCAIIRPSLPEAQAVEAALEQQVVPFGIFRSTVEKGALMSYAPVITDAHRAAAVYVDKLLKGAKAADWPVEQPTMFGAGD